MTEHCFVPLVLTKSLFFCVFYAVVGKVLWLMKESFIPLQCENFVCSHAILVVTLLEQKAQQKPLRKGRGQQKSSGLVFVIQNWQPKFNPSAHIRVGGWNQLQKTIFWPPYVNDGTVYTYNNNDNNYNSKKKNNRRRGREKERLCFGQQCDDGGRQSQQQELEAAGHIASKSGNSEWFIHTCAQLMNVLCIPPRLQSGHSAICI